MVSLLLYENYSNDDLADYDRLPTLIKNFELNVDKSRDLDEAISTDGGISLNELNTGLELIKRPGSYCIGEMVDFDTPTGGFLLQAAFSMAYRCVQSIIGNHHV